jgi:hypothetical protein
LVPAAGPHGARGFHKLLLSEGEELRSHEPSDRHPAEATDDHDNHDEHAALYSEYRLQLIAEEVDYEEEKRQLG